MKRIVLFLALMSCCTINSRAQSPDTLNTFRYFFLPQLYYEKGKPDIYGIRKAVAEKLSASTLPLFLEEKEISRDALKNPCSMIHCIVSNTASSTGGNASVISILFLNCKNDTVLSCSALANAKFTFRETCNSYISATKKALEIFSNYHYQFAASDSISTSIKTASLESDSIPWNSERKLTWDDFKGTADSISPADALTFTSNQTDFQSYGMGDRFETESKITCCFIKSKSWVRAGKQNEYLLNHEQRHFDIAETGAREFRKIIQRTHLTVKNFQEEIKRITQDVNEKYHTLQLQYDSETDHSRVEEKQKEWNEKIEKMLKDLEEYK